LPDLILRLGLSVFGGALLGSLVCDTSGDADSDAQSSAQLVGVHSRNKFNSGENGTHFPHFSGADSCPWRASDVR
jgi:hypothetical protein